MPSLKEIVAESKKRGYSKRDLFKELVEKGYSKKEIEEAFGSNVGKARGADKEVNYFDKIKYLFSNPNYFFQSVREKTIGRALILYLIVGLIASFMGIGVSFIFSRFFFSNAFVLLGSLFSFAFLGLSLAGTFVYSGISHLVVKGFRGGGNYVDSYNVVAYSLIPYLLISVIPFVGFLAIIYSIVLMIFGFSEYHKITKGKAAFAALLPVIIAILLVGLFIVYLLFALRNLF